MGEMPPNLFLRPLNLYKHFMINFQLQGQEFIELIRLLKLLGLVDTGGEAKNNVDSGKVKVNNEVEFRKRRKLKSGDLVSFSGETISIK
jgi:ribosome-associated protein